MFGPVKGKKGDIGKSDDELVKQLIEIHNSENWLGDSDSDLSSARELCESPDSGVGLEQPSNEVSQTENKQERSDPHCYECKVRYRDPEMKDLIMFLHALKYQVEISFFQN